jgi:hypothetical protein
MRLISYPNKQAFSRTIFLQGRKSSNNEDVKLQKLPTIARFFILIFVICSAVLGLLNFVTRLSKVAFIR